MRKRARLSKAGDPRLRTALFLPTRAAARFNPLVRAFYARPVGAGKAKMRAIGACMRKLVTVCYGVLKAARRSTRADFDP